jgi:Na+/proline symporter
MRIWLSKPLYEMLPYFYLLAGSACLLASLYLNYWYWPIICLVTGVVCLVLGLVVFLRRRDFRMERKPAGKDRKPG